MVRINNEYSPWKAAFFQENIDTLKKGQLCPPVHLQIALTNACNNGCYYCFVGKKNDVGAKLNTQTLLNLLEDAKSMGVKAITLAGGGEPTVHRGFYVIVDKIRTLGLELGVFTNGALIWPDKLDFASWVRISLDSYDPTVYRAMRNVSLPDLRPIERLCRDTKVTMGASAVITPLNYDRLYEFGVTSRDIGFDYVWLNPVQLEDNPNVLDPFVDEIEEQLTRLQELEADHFKVFCPKSRMGAQANKTKPFAKCLLQHFTGFIWPTGDIYPCCETQGLTEYAIGNIYDGGFRDVWFSRTPLEVRDCHLPCLRRDKNIFMNYLIEENAPHKNFI